MKYCVYSKIVLYKKTVIVCQFSFTIYLGNMLPLLGFLGGPYAHLIEQLQYLQEVGPENINNPQYSELQVDDLQYIFEYLRSWVEINEIRCDIRIPRGEVTIAKDRFINQHIDEARNNILHSLYHNNRIGYRMEMEIHYRIHFFPPQ